jgi:hypothetical protein
MATAAPIHVRIGTARWMHAKDDAFRVAKKTYQYGFIIVPAFND